jgi:hypothetical protein
MIREVRVIQNIAIGVINKAKTADKEEVGGRKREKGERQE